MSIIYRRPALARQMARQLVNPGVLDEGLRSGLFLSGLRRTGKTTFLRSDLIPALEEAGALVIYVDLWSDTQTDPAALVLGAIRRTLEELQRPSSSLLRRLARISGMEAGGFGFRFGFELEHVGEEGGPTLARALTEIVDQADTDVVLIVDEVQHAITSEEGQRLLLALKAARDAINPRLDSDNHFIFIGTGSHRALVNELTARRSQAFAGATSVAYPVLDRGYVEHLFARLAAELRRAERRPVAHGRDEPAVTSVAALGAGSGEERAWPLPSVEIATRAFASLGHRPEEMIKALKLLRSQLPPGADPDVHFPVIAATLRTAAVDTELTKVELLGGLATAVFERIAAVDGHARGVYSAAAVETYSRDVGRRVRVEEIQPVVNDLLAANLIMRRGHGLYGVTDPFVQQIWRERRALGAGLEAPEERPRARTERS